MKTFVALALAATLSRADIPMTLVSEDEAEPIHSAIIRKEAWTQDPVRRLRADADRRMKEGPWSVVTDRPKGVDIDVHEYYTEAPYYWLNPDNPTGPYLREDGHSNPARIVANQTAMNAMGNAVFSLGVASFLLDNPAYGKRAAAVIHTWFVNPRTRMNPDLDYAQSIPGVNNGRGSGVVDGRDLIRAIQGMEFLEQTNDWSVRDQAAVHRWFEEYLRWLLTSRNATDEQKSGNNHASWWAAEVAAVGSFLDDPKAQQLAFNFYRDYLLPRQIMPNGSAPHEEVRARSLRLSSLNLDAFSTLCRIAQVHGNAGLWAVRARSGASIASALDYLSPFLDDPKKWSREQAGDIPYDSLDFLAFAGMAMNNPRYIADFRKLEHPDSAWMSLIDLLVGRFEAAAHQTRH
ncbi:MAG TPA: alginate lyase family protein [Bryobacteraceae bacterium]|nr:alginate lyase family protein [Bryobacteraceae bacterium]